jgi:hypothetical protein
MGLQIYRRRSGTCFLSPPLRVNVCVVVVQKRFFAAVARKSAAAIFQFSVAITDVVDHWPTLFPLRERVSL